MFTETSNLSGYEPAEDWKDEAVKGKLLDIQRDVKAQLEKGVKTIPEIVENTGHDNQMVFNVLAKMVEKGEVVKNAEAKSGFNQYTLAAGAPKAEKKTKPKTDRDGFETGGYKPPEAREKIIQSLTDIPYQSSRHMCANTGANIDDVLEVVEGDDEITFQMVGSIAVYYLRTNEPQGKLYNSGNNSFLVKEEEKKPLAAKRSKGGSRVTPEAVEECAFDGLGQEASAKLLGISIFTFRDYIYRDNYPDLREAWNRGKQRRKDAGLPSLQSMSMSKRMGKEKAVQSEQIAFSSIPVTDAEDEAFKERFPVLSKHDVLEEILDLPDEQFAEVSEVIKDKIAESDNGLLEIPQLVEKPIVYNSREMNAAIVQAVACDDCHSRTGQYCAPVVSDSIEWIYDALHASRVRKYHSMNEALAPNASAMAKRTLDKLYETNPLPVRDFELHFESTVEIREPHNYRVVTLSNGKKIFISDDINIFELSSREAKFCATLVELVNEFEREMK